MARNKVSSDEGRGIDSPFDPDIEEAKTVAAKSSAKAAGQVPIRVAEPKEDKTYLYLTERYKIKLKPDSGYRTFLRLMAKEGHFAGVARLLGRTDFNASDPVQAKRLLDMVMVRRDAIEQVLRNDKCWQQHSETRMAQLQRRAKDGSSKARATISNRKRVQGGKWVGDVQEIISTCCGSWKNSNRNVRKFDEAGITFRKYPMRPAKDEPVYLMMFPAEYAKDVVTALRSVFGEKAKRERVPEKFLS